MPLARLLDALRRLATAALLLALTPVLLVALPLVLFVAGARDLAARDGRWARVRMSLMAAHCAVLEFVAVVAAIVLWVATAAGVFLRRPWSQRAHYRVQEWWAHRLVGACRRWLGLRFDVENPEVLGNDPVIFATHHASFFDALLPSVLLRASDRRPARHVLKKELRHDPCLGIYGARQPNRFVDRSTGDSAELEAIHDLAATAESASIAIFPEGTFRSATDPVRVFARLAEDDPQRAERLRLAHMLPARPGGLLSLMHGAPDHDVIFVAHAGLASAGSLRAIARAIPFAEPVPVHLWRVGAHSFCDHQERALERVDAAWQEMDDWIGSKG